MKKILTTLQYMSENNPYFKNAYFHDNGKSVKTFYIPLNYFSQQCEKTHADYINSLETFSEDEKLNYITGLTYPEKIIDTVFNKVCETVFHLNKVGERYSNIINLNQIVLNAIFIVTEDSEQFIFKVSLYDGWDYSYPLSTPVHDIATHCLYEFEKTISNCIQILKNEICTLIFGFDEKSFPEMFDNNGYYTESHAQQVIPIESDEIISGYFIHNSEL